MFPDHRCCATTTKVVMWGEVADGINCSKFRLNSFMGFGSLGVESCHFYILSAMVYINTAGLGYHSTCDVAFII